MTATRKPPLVTVYLTNHNYGQYLRQSVESVLGQTLQDFELLIIDDGSTDDSREIIGEYESDPRVTVIFQQNKGLNVTNNIALRTARGKYIMRLDADDYLDAHALQILSGVMEREADVGMVFPDYFLVDAEGGVIELVRRHDFGDVSVMDQPAHGACTMFRRQELVDLGGYDETFRCQDGWDIWVRFIHRHKVRNVNLPLFYYRQHADSLTRNESMILETRAAILRRQDTGQQKAHRTVAVITVRGAVANRNSVTLRPLAGKPLIDWTIEPLLASQTVSRIVVSTPDRDVQEHVRKTFADAVDVHERSLKLALPNSRIEDTLIQALDHAERDGERYDLLLHLGISNPFRAADSFGTIIDVMTTFETDTVVAVRPETDIFYQHNGHGLVPLRQSQALRLEREELFRDTGAMRLIAVPHLRATGRVIGDRVGHMVLDQRSAFALRSDMDWEVAEALIERDGQDGQSANPRGIRSRL